MVKLNSIELCAGAGGQAFGLELAGFEHAALVEIDKHSCATLRTNRPEWRVFEEDLNHFDASAFKGIDLLAAGLPCPPFSKAGKQLGKADERNLFPAALEIISTTKPSAVMIENVRGLMDASFSGYRDYISSQIKKMGYTTEWHLLNASDFGVPQLRPRVVFVAIKNTLADHFSWPEKGLKKPFTVGETLYDLMASNGWNGAKNWKLLANDIAPTIVGGSHKHGGPDLGPTRAKKAWAKLGVDGMIIANEPPEKNFTGMPRLTVRMVARIQGFPDSWHFQGKKTPAYRQVGNAFPPPVAQAVAEKIFQAVQSKKLVPVAA